MKRVIALFLLVLFIIGSVSCIRAELNDWEGLDALGNTAAPTESEPEETAFAETEAPAEPTDTAVTAEPSPSITPEPATETPDATEEPSPAPSPTVIPTDGPTSAPTEAPLITPAPTAAASALPTLTPIPGPSTPTPAPITGGAFTFQANSSLPLPSMNEVVPAGQPFCFGGTVKCDNPITAVTAEIATTSGSTVLSKTVSFDASEGKTSVELVDRTFPKTGNTSLTAQVKFETLPAGTYYFNLYAAAVGVPCTLLSSSQFKIVSSEWRQLISNNLRNNYSYALSFFGSRDEFMFSYKWKNSTDRDIIIESGWDSAHISTVTNPSGGNWYVHRKAVPYYERAISYMKNSYVRVHGTNGDTGVLRLSSLIGTFDGTLNHRFVSDRTFVSHHTFGTAIDLNASMDANQNSMSNRNLIKNEVRDHLTYNGIMEHDGVRYYDFTYDGSHSSKYKGVPTTVINYLLYELAFYRAGFNWGYYYYHTCDAMHFGLSEMSADIHNTSGRSLRKVYDYTN